MLSAKDLELKGENMKSLQSKIEPEDMKCKVTHMYPQENKI